MASIRGYSPDPEVGGSVKTTAQILAAIDAAAGSGRSLPELLCVDCTTALGLSGCVMALMNDAGHQGVVGASGGVAAQLEDLQFELGEGPSVDASHLARPVLHSDLVTAGEMSAGKKKCRFATRGPPSPRTTASPFHLGTMPSAHC